MLPELLELEVISNKGSYFRDKDAFKIIGLPKTLEILSLLTEKRLILDQKVLGSLPRLLSFSTD